MMARNRFYQMLKDSQYKPANEDMRKRLIGWKLQQISRRQRLAMEESRRQAGVLIEKAASGIRNTEQLLQSFYPNVHRIMQERTLRASMKRKQQQEEQQLS
jgi:hypothetical protein